MPDAPQQEYVPLEEVKRFLRLEQLQHTVKRPVFGWQKQGAVEHRLPRDNAGDILAAVGIIERYAPKGTQAPFPAALVEELKTSLPGLGSSTETVERMAALLDRMEASVQVEIGSEKRSGAGDTYREHHAESARKRADADRQREKRRR
jgi:hypothetical protein